MQVDEQSANSFDHFEIPTAPPSSPAKAKKMRTRKPYARKARGVFLAWYVLHGGKQVWLGRYEQEANDNYKRLLAGQPVIRPSKTVASNAPTVTEICKKFLAFKKISSASGTHKWYHIYLRSFCMHEGTGQLQIATIKPHHVSAWINPKLASGVWSDNSAHSAGRCLTTCFRWATEEGLIAVNPLAKFRKHRAVTREDCSLTKEQWAKIIGAIKEPQFLDAVQFMRLTGCRPLECRMAEARHFKGDNLTFPKSESKGKRHERVIWLSGEPLLIVQRLIALYPTGRLFRNSKGENWATESFSRRFKTLSKKLGISNAIPYSCRYSFINDAVVRGVDSLVLARLVGHVDTKMLMKVYARHQQRNEFMVEQAAKAVAGV